MVELRIESIVVGEADGGPRPVRPGEGRNGFGRGNAARLQSGNEREAGHPDTAHGANIAGFSDKTGCAEHRAGAGSTCVACNAGSA